MRSKILSEFRLVSNIVGHLLSDIELSSSKAVVYNFDYSLLYPWLWRQADQKDPHYDLVGRNIFALYPRYTPSSAFSICFTVPSILELLDTLEHRHDRSSAMAQSSLEVENLISAFKIASSRDFNSESEEGKKVERYLRSFPLGNENHRINQLVGEFRAGRLRLAHELFSKESLKAASPDITKDYDAVFDKMRSRRSFADARREEDRLFHYRVDSWNVAFRQINKYSNDTEISYICRQTIRDFFPGDAAQLYSRHPLVPMYQLYALLAAPEGSFVKREASDFIVDALKHTKECINFLEKESDEELTNVTFYWREKIDNTYNKFIRPLFFDYSDDAKGINMKEFDRRRRESRHGEYKSVMTPEGFRERFAQDADSMKNLATSIVELNPEIVSDRLLEEYDLSNNPRVQEIFRKFNLG